MDKKISKYISENKVLTFATCVDNIPYCSNCFYVFDSDNNRLIFLSDSKTRHITEALSNKNVAGTIDKEFISVAKIQGLQFTGCFVNPDSEEEKNFYKIYYDKFPFAKAKPSPIWAIDLAWVKMTDNTLGFGKKIIWESAKKNP